MMQRTVASPNMHRPLPFLPQQHWRSWFLSQHELAASSGIVAHVEFESCN